MNEEQELQAMALLGLTEEPAVQRHVGCGEDGTRISLYDSSGNLLGVVFVDPDGNVSLGS
jgi:hypothetical protein